MQGITQIKNALIFISSRMRRAYCASRRGCRRRSPREAHRFVQGMVQHGLLECFFLLFRPVLYTLDAPKRQRKAEEGQRNNVISAVENMSATSSVAQPRNVEAVA